MKKFALIGIILFLSISNIFSQSDKTFRFGIHGSPSLAWLKSENKMHESKGLTLGFGYGLIAEFAITDNYAFVLGLESVYSGGKLQWSNNDTITTATYKMQYAEIPLVLKMKTSEINYITYFAKFGGGLNLRLRSHADFLLKDQQGNSLPSLLDENIQGDINLFRITFLVGMGIEYSLGGSTALLVGLNFNNGLTDIFKDKDFKARNNFVNLNMGIIF